MERLFLTLLSRSVSAAWLVAVVLVLRLVLRRAPKSLRCLLWALVAVRLVCPVSIESALSLVPRTDVPAAIEERIELPAPAAQSAAPETPTVIVPPSTNATLPIIPAQAAETPVPETRGVRLSAVLAWAWLAVAAGMTLYALGSYLRLRRRVAASLPHERGVRVCDSIASPFILGVVRPCIYLPSGLSEEQARLVLAHERAHLRRGDHLWKPLGWALLTVYCFNPALWLAYALLCRDIELATDERVLRELGAEVKKPYSEALLACAAPQHLIAACPVAFGEVGVKTRIRNVLNYKKPAFWLVVLAVLACAAAAVFFLTDPRQERTVTEDSGSISLTGIESKASGSGYTVTIRHEPLAQDAFSDALHEAMRQDWATWYAMAKSAQMIQSKAPGFIWRSFETWYDGVEFLGLEPDNPLETSDAFEKKNWTGTDVAEDGRLLRAYVSADGDAEGELTNATIRTGYMRGNVRVQSVILLTTDGSYTADSRFDGRVRFDTEQRTAGGSPALVVYPRGGEHEQAIVYLLRGQAVYTFHLICDGENGADEVRAAVDDVLAAFDGGGVVAPSGTFTDLMGMSGVIASSRDASGKNHRVYYAVTEDGKRAVIAESVSYEPSDYITDLDGDGVTELICNQTSSSGYAYVSVYRREGTDILRGRPDRDEAKVADWDDSEPHFTRGRYDYRTQEFELTYRSVLTGSGYAVLKAQGLEIFSWERYASFDPEAMITLAALHEMAASKPLTWEMLRDYPHTDIGSGLYIPLFQTEIGCSLTVGMMSPEGEIAYAWLQAQDPPYESFDLLSGTVEELDAYLAAIARPSSERTHGAFTDVLGMDGFWEDVFDGSRAFCTRSYYAAVGGAAPGGYVKIAESFGYGAQDYVRDLDGDGVKELICCNTYGADGAQRVTVYRLRGGKIEAGTVGDRITLPGWDNWGVGSFAEIFDEEADSLAVRYDKTDGTTGTVIFGMEALTFETYLDYDPRTVKEPAAASYTLSGTSLIYDGTEYDLRTLYDGINAAMSVTPAGRYLVVEGHINPQVGGYGIFDTVSRAYVNAVFGTNLVWRGDDLQTGVYELRGTIYAYDGAEIGTPALAEGEYIRSLALDASGAYVTVEIMGLDGVPRYETFAHAAGGLSAREAAKAAFGLLLSGDTSLLADASVGRLLAETILPTGGLEYALLDLDGDGVEELTLQYENDPRSFNAVFRYAGGKIDCFVCDVADGAHWEYPLRDGTMVHRYEESGVKGWTLFRYRPDGTHEDLTAIVGRSEPLPGDGVSHYPYYSIDGGEVDEATFDRRLQELVENRELTRAAWTLLPTRAADPAREALLRALRSELPFTLDAGETRSYALGAPTTLAALTAEDTARDESPAYAFLDLDGDGVEEAVYRRGDYRGFYVLRYWEGAVYGCEFSYRGMMALKTDGTFYASGGASSNGCGRLHFFDGAAHEVEYFLWRFAPTQFTINGQGVSEAEYRRAEEVQAAKPDVVWRAMDTRSAVYGGLLRDLYAGLSKNGKAELPDGAGTLHGSTGAQSMNRFAVCDVDGDGTDELLIGDATASAGGNGLFVYDYNAPGGFHLALRAQGAVTFYSNGTLTENWSHNEAGSGTIWPYYLCRYNAGLDRYQYASWAMAWEKQNRIGGPFEGRMAFPDDLDLDGDGVLYYVSDVGAHTDVSHLIDKAAYDAWVKGWRGGAQEIVPAWQDFTLRNIEALTR